MLSVFEHVGNLHIGLEKLEWMLTQHHRSLSTDLFRYSFGVMHIQRRLSNKKDVMAVIAKRLQQAEKQSEHFGYTHDNLVSNIAHIYSDTISKFQYRIQVTGDYNYLQQERIANQVRALLLAGIRASLLWRQIGGTRWQFIFQHDQLLNTCRDALKEAKQMRFH